MSDERDPRDPTLDAAWRAHSSETPPAALDRTILAAAHRAVGSAPRASPAATRPWRWWMPLAAAATIGAIAIGVLQTLPPEPDEIRVVASDTPAPPAAREDAAAPALARSAPAPRPVAPPESPPAAREATPAAPEPPASAAARPPRAGASPPRPAAPPPTPKSQAPREDAGAERGVDAASTHRAQRAPEPFPARKEGAREATGAAPLAPGTMAEPADVPAAVPPPPVTAAAPRPPNDPASGPTADRSQSATGLGDRAVTAGAARRSVAGEAPLGKSIAGAEPAPAREPDAWIARIRALHAAGNLEEAARELAAFRAAYRDADARLPESLRAWAATIRP
jgi:hypothetical protein